MRRCRALGSQQLPPEHVQINTQSPLMQSFNCFMHQIMKHIEIANLQVPGLNLVLMCVYLMFELTPNCFSDPHPSLRGTISTH